jgi:phosphotransacetylase
VVITGTADTRAPTEKIRLARITLPAVLVGRDDAMTAVLARAATGTPVITAVVYPVDALSLAAAMDAAARGLITPILIGPLALMQDVAAANHINLGAARLLSAATPREAASQAVQLARDGEAGLLMKGDLHTDILMHEVIATGTGLRMARTISHVYVMDVPDYPRLLLVTDAGINITPNLATKAGIVQNAIDVAHVIGIAMPRVAILAAVETVNPRMPATLDAAALCKMADRGQITGGLLDGPLAFDNAVSAAAAADKGIISPVAGKADILLVPDLEAGNMLAKQLTFLSGAQAAGVVVGALVPIILTSRADGAATRVASCALGVLLARAATQMPA